MKRQGRLVLVGERLCVAEEYLPGKGTYDLDGNIYSAFVGIVNFDRRSLTVSVTPIKKRKRFVPNIGDIVVAEVFLARSQSAMCKIFKVGEYFLFDSYTAMLHVSDMSRSYLTTVDEGFRATDIIRAKVIGFYLDEYRLSTKGPRLGVIYAECINCGTRLTLENKRLKCNLCGFPNPRKIANDYGRIKEKMYKLH
ncbi:MAG: exosome complex RNA-binding protein Csl4 [Promethearchaeota archaeon]